mmetsp:Transcript_57048/g.99736  ORF Transcript_57048/g.99736 Transcript_57048/m.99736 type:complete len:242 (+) Transcript_57048:529-1254(+)
MCIDVIDVLDCHASLTQGLLHGPASTLSTRGRYVVSITGVANSSHLSVDLGSAFLCVLKLFQNQNTCAFSHDEATASLVKRPRGLGRLIIAVCRQSPHLIETGNGQRLDGRLSPAGNHHVRITILDESICIANAMSTGGTCSDSGCVRALRIVLHGDETRGKVDEHLGDEARRNLAHAFVHFRDVCISDVLNTANATSNRHSRPHCVLLRLRLPSCIIHGLLCGHHGILDEGCHLLGLFLA